MIQKSDYEKRARHFLKQTGISINGKKPINIKVNDLRVYKRIFTKGSLGVGESYMDGWWECEKLDDMLFEVVQMDWRKYLGKNPGMVWFYTKSRLLNQQRGDQAYKNAQDHYDIGNDMYEPMLGKTMGYTCAYWQWGAKTLDQAQTDKFELVCQKLGLKKGMRVLDPGCGWGGLSIYMAKKYGCEVVCFTPAKEQIAYIKDHTKGLKVKPLMSSWQDYKEKGKFDRIASIGMLEHVGVKNYKAYLTRMKELLKDDGYMVLHTIACNVRATDEWVDKYIFPGGMLPSPKDMATAFQGIFILEDWHNFGPDYDKTLQAWYTNFKKSYPKLDHNKYDERFYRMWEFYLMSMAAQFRARRFQLWQLVLSKNGIKGGYKSIR